MTVQNSPPRGGEEAQSASRWEKESHDATRELLKVKDRLIEIERNVSSKCTTHRKSIVNHLKAVMPLFHRHYQLNLPRLGPPFFTFPSPKSGTWYLVLFYSHLRLGSKRAELILLYDVNRLLATDWPECCHWPNN